MYNAQLTMYNEEFIISVKNILMVFIILFSLNQFTLCQNDERVLAKIGSEKITVEEYINRFDFMPYLNYSSSNIDSIKKEFLYSLVAEKLWALEADELKIDTIESVKLSLKSLENLFVKDELYKEVVESKITLTGEEISKGILQATRLLSTLIITSADSLKIWSLYNKLENGSSFDSVLNVLKIPQKPFEVKYGSFEDEGMEEILFLLKLNEISEPIKNKGSWFIFKLIDDQEDKSIDPSKDHAKNIVIKKLKDRKSQKLGRNFLDSLLSGKSITADRRLFDLFADGLLEVLKIRAGKIEGDSLIDIHLSEKDILK
ncbi:MAG: hypothetical protein Q8M94_17775, partial [Ignavibacteria bacterium]|nr:hypothetical protein [Ignavibacteria bacterium]